MKIPEYLNRIRLANLEPLSYKFLSILQMNHLLHIPFEDLDIPFRDKIILDFEKIYDKVIFSGRGGFCYELNGLFRQLLIGLGFKVDLLSASVYNKERNDLGPEFDHMTLLVHLEEDYLVDVGFGDSFRRPIRMPDGESTDISGHYKILQKNRHEYELVRKEDDDWHLQFIFTDTPRLISDFNEMCEYQQNFPGSVFRNRMLCTKATEEGRITLTDNSLTFTNRGIKEKRTIKDTDEFDDVLYQHFGIKLK